MTADHPFPPVVYVPTLEPGSDDEARLAMHRTDDGRVALFVYSALDRLVEYYRADSPWALLTVPDLQRAYDTAPYDLIFLDKRPALATDGS
jgi:hypothetical protein